MRNKERVMGKCTVEVFSRVTGFFRPVQDWNPGKGKGAEFSDRKKFDKSIKKDSK